MTITDILIKLSSKIKEGIKISPPIKIELTNIATLHDNDEGFDKSNIILSIVNIEEDKTLKNQSLYKKEITAVTIDGVNTHARGKYKKPAQNLIFSILFSSYIKQAEKYTEGLEKLEQVIRYLQYNNVFFFDDDKIYEETEKILPVSLENKLIIEMVSLKSDQLNQMWSYLGSKYMPSVLYSLRLTRIQNETTKLKPIIKQIENQSIQKNIKDSELEEGKTSVQPPISN